MDKANRKNYIKKKNAKKKNINLQQQQQQQQLWMHNFHLFINTHNDTNFSISVKFAKRERPKAKKT